MGEGDPLQVDGSFYSLKQEVPPFGVELKIPLTRLAPPPGLEREGGLKDRKHSRVRIKPDFILKTLTLLWSLGAIHTNIFMTERNEVINKVHESVEPHTDQRILHHLKPPFRGQSRALNETLQQTQHERKAKLS